MREWWRKLCIFHDWGKWEQKEEQWLTMGSVLIRHDPVKYTQLLQTRTCSRCGKLQREKINC